MGMPFRILTYDGFISKIQEITDALAAAAGVGSSAFASRETAIAANIPAIVQTISVMHHGEKLDYRRNPSGWTTSNVPLTTAGGVRWVPAGIPTIKHWGAVPDCDPATFAGTDSRNAIWAALVWVRDTQAGRLHINPGKYLVVKPASGNVLRPLSRSLHLTGDGAEISQIYFKDMVDMARKQPLFYQHLNDVIDFLHIDGIGFISDWGFNDNWVEVSQMFSLGFGPGVFHLTNCLLKNGRSMFVATGKWREVFVSGNRFENSYRDGMRAGDSNNIKIIGNHFQNVSDDCIALPRKSGHAGPIEASAIVMGNTIVDSQGIYCAGAKNTIIADNVLIRPTVRGISVGMEDSVFTEGLLARINISITNNTIVDMFRRVPFGGQGDARAYISVTDAPAPTTSAAIKAEGDLHPTEDGKYVYHGDGQGGVVKPHPYYHTHGNHLGNVNVEVSNNRCIRTLAPVASYLEYGYGPRYVQGIAPYTGVVTDAHFVQEHIFIKGTMRNMKVSGNISVGAVSPIKVVGFGDRKYPDFENFRITGNILSEYTGPAAIQFDGWEIVDILDNDIDGDPLHVHPTRLPAGKWSADTFAAILIQGGKARIGGGNIKNVGRILSGVSADVIAAGPVTVHANLAAVGDHAENAGVRNVQHMFPVHYARTDCDPGSATFRQVTSVSLSRASAMPTAGHYVAGQVVQNAVPAVVSGQIVTGWVRMTTGNGHVPGVDWRELRSSV